MTDVSQILDQAASGDPAAAAKLLPLVYDELRKLANVRLAQEKPGQRQQRITGESNVLDTHDTKCDLSLTPHFIATTVGPISFSVH